MRIVFAKDLKIGDKVSSAEKQVRTEFGGDGYVRYGYLISMETSGEFVKLKFSCGSRHACSPGFPFAVDREDEKKAPEFIGRTVLK